MQTDTSLTPTERAAATQRSTPAFVISLDFELRWGRHDRLGLDMDADRKSLEGAREAVPRMLELFLERGLRATWAVVGAVACHDWIEFFDRAPEAPRYLDSRLRIHPAFAELDPEGHLHFAPELVDRISASPGQELGTHTFTHLLMGEPGVRAEDVTADLAAVNRLWRERYGAPPRSLVFPRNQPAFLGAVRDAGIRIWRSNPGPWYYDCTDAATNGTQARLLRLLDDLTPWTRHARPSDGSDTAASRFLRLDLPGPAWSLLVRHLRHELEELRPGDVFHLWWHPHNLGGDLETRLDRVRQVVDLAAERIARRTLVSRSMGDLVA